MTWKTYLDQNQSRFVGELVDFVRIPSVSALDEHFNDVVKAGNWVVERLKAAGAVIERTKQLHLDTKQTFFSVMHTLAGE